MAFNETVELIVPVYASEEEHALLLLYSLQVTCKNNVVFPTFIDVEGSLKDGDLARLARSSQRVSVLSDYSGSRLVSSVLQHGLKHVRGARPESVFFGFSHADTIAVSLTWLDSALDALLDGNVGCVGFVPGGSLYTGSKEISYVDDWLMITRADVLDRILPFPSSLKSFGLAPWYHAALSKLGLEERLISAGDGCQLVAHTRKRGRLTGGRKNDPALREEEIANLRAEIAKITGISA